MAELLKGAPVAAALTEELNKRAEVLKERGINPTLAIVRVGENDSDLAYERGAMKRCEKVGINVKQFVLPYMTSTDNLIEVIEQINNDPEIDGCLMFRPLPRQIIEPFVCKKLNPAKDVDCMTDSSLSTVFTGHGLGFAPCTAQSCLEILDYYGYNLVGAKVTVIGRSLVIGKPVSMMLQARGATVTMCHTKTKDVAAECRDAEIVVVAAGHANTFRENFTNPNQVVIDVGINVDDSGNMCGDADFAAVETKVAAITPVPGGVGAVTTAVLCKHIIEAAEQR